MYFTTLQDAAGWNIAVNANLVTLKHLLREGSKEQSVEILVTKVVFEMHFLHLIYRRALEGWSAKE